MTYVISDSDFLGSWEMLERSGYAKLWAVPGMASRMRDMYLKYWNQASADEGICLTMRDADSGDVVATACGNAYGGSDWILHHLSCLPKKSDTLLREDVRDIITALAERVLAKPWVENFVMHFERNKSVNRRIWLDFADGYGDPSKVSVRHASVYRRLTDEPMPATVAAVPFVPDEIRTGDEGANIFGLMNACRSPLTTVMPLTRAGHLRWITEHFASLGKSHFVLLDDAHEDAIPECLGFVREPDGTCVTIHRDAAPAWLAYLKQRSEEKRPESS